MGKSQRVKGHNFEREIAKIIRDIYPEAKRGLQYQSGKHCPDVVGTPFAIECKKGKCTYPKKALEQAIKDKLARNDNVLIPIAVTKDDFKDTLVTMLFNDFLKIISIAKREKNE